MRKAFIGIGLAAGLYGLGSGPAWADGIAQLDQFLKSTRSASGHFEQVTTDRQGRVAQNGKMSGRFLFQRVGKFVWRYEKPYVQVAYSNGKTLSLWDPDLNQLTIRKVDQVNASSPAAILFGQADLRKNFEVRNLQKEGDLEWVEALPRSADSGFQFFRIGFQENLPKQIQIVDNFGQTVQVDFSSFQANPKLEASQFEFTAPKGAEILRQ